MALSVTTGAVDWTADIPVRGPVVHEATRLFVPTDDGVAALDVATGHAVWTREVEGHPVVALTSKAGWVFVLTERAGVHALRADTGELVWTRSLPSPARARPVVAGTLLFVASLDGAVTALGVTAGEEVWRTAVEGEPVGLAVDANRLYFGTRGKFFYCLNASDGRVDWRWRIGAEVVGVPLVDDRHVYVVAYDNLVRALDRSHGAQRWRTPLPARPVGSPVAVGNSLVVPYLAAEVRAISSKNGASQGRYPTDRELAGSPLVVDRPYQKGGELLLLVASDGSVLALERRVEPPVIPLTALPGVGVPLTPPGESTPAALPGPP